MKFEQWKPASAKAPEPERRAMMKTRVPGTSVVPFAGFPVKPKTLATKATRGGGPPFRKWSGRPLYRWGDSLAWAQGLLTEPRHSTSE
jgi:hypothetical protein